MPWKEQEWKRSESNEKKLLKEGVFIIVINDEKEEETIELETLIMTEIYIQEFKARATMSWCLSM